MIQAIYLNQDKQMIIKFLDEEKIAPLSLGTEVLKTLCIQNGATYEGRRNATMKILKVKQKVPILLSAKELLFPTHSPEHQECTWLNYYAIDKVHKHTQGCMIEFLNHTQLVLTNDIRTIRMQMKRCVIYDSYLTHHERSN